MGDAWDPRRSRDEEAEPGRPDEDALLGCQWDGFEEAALAHGASESFSAPIPAEPLPDWAALAGAP